MVVQIFCAWAPMTAALLLYGNHYHWIFAGLLVPSFFGMKFIAERLRRTLLDAVIASRDMTLLATRFDTALNNMPHGLCMFDAERHIVVSNQKLNQQLGLAPDWGGGKASAFAGWWKASPPPASSSTPARRA